jgi:molecular chaperone DnaK
MTIRAVGIDLGATNSVMACLNTIGYSEMFHNREGKLHTPSLVLLGDDRTIVGDEARLRGKKQPERLATGAKQDMGRRHYPQPLGGEMLPPEVIQACVLRHLQDGLTHLWGSQYGCVLGVPAYFNDAQRQATADAAEMADLRLLDVLNEPVAAALAFEEHVPAGALHGPDSVGRHVLVYDLGAYKFEATLLRIEAQTYTTIATVADPYLGGHDWDIRLAEHLAAEFSKTHGIDPRSDAAGLEQVIHAATQAKLALTARPATRVTIRHFGHEESFEVSREQFERLTHSLWQRSVRHMKRLLHDSDLKWPDVSRLLLVGGASRMPMIRNRLRAEIGIAADQQVNPEEAVARGAAIYAGHLLRPGDATASRSPLVIRNVSTHSLGIEGVDPQSGQRLNKILIPRGTSLPARAHKEFVTKANAQRSISITVLEGESADPRQCTILGRAVLRELPEDLTTEWPVEVSCEYSGSGRLTMDAHIRYTDRAVHLELLRTCGVSAAHRGRWKAAVCKAAGFAEFQRLAELERNDELPPPIVMAISPPEATSVPQHGVQALLQRLPFLHRSRVPAGVPVPASGLA